MLKRKLLEWLKRYLPAELLSTAVTLAAAWLVHNQGGNGVVLALISTWSGNITYYGYILTADIRKSIKVYHAAGKRYDAAAIGINFRSLVVEFGPAEALDTLLIRPLAMYYIPLLINGFSTGIVVAKLTADLVFYIPAILGYEMNKKLLKKPA